MKRALHIVDPCRESWESMPGSASQRSCDRCGKEVHALAALTRSEAERLFATAPREALCVRIELDEAGEVRFKRESSGGQVHPLLRVAAGASLLVAGCGHADPSGAPSASALPAAPSVQIAAEPPAPARVEEASPPAPPSSPADAGDADAGQACVPSGADAGVKARQGGPRGASSVLMGCVCLPDDPLCSCL